VCLRVSARLQSQFPVDYGVKHFFLRSIKLGKYKKYIYKTDTYKFIEKCIIFRMLKKLIACPDLSVYSYPVTKKEEFHIMENPIITEHRIRGERFYTIEKSNKIAFYTTNIAAARYWVKHVVAGQSVALPQADADLGDTKTS
jgi:hypothetical protein